MWFPSPNYGAGTKKSLSKLKAAVLVSVADWNAREKRLEILEARLKYLEMKRQFEENPSKMVSFDAIEESVKARR